MIRARTAARVTLAGLTGSLLGVLAVAGPAAAHVTVDPGEATQGGFGRVAFRVPNESDTTNTTKVEVFLPQQPPIASVSTMTVPGWTVAVSKAKPTTPVQAEGSQVTEVVTKITWTASAGAVIRAGQFQEFPVSLGPLPKTDKLVFKTLQTYSDGTIVRWIDEPVAAGAEEPANPAPVVTLAKAADVPAAGGSAAPVPTSGVTAAAAADPDDGDGDGDGAGMWLGLAGLVAGLAGLALGGLAFARTRKTAGGPTG